jgi:hypothetical protein
MRRQIAKTSHHRVRSTDPWNGDAIRRAAVAIREAWCNDSYRLARATLEAAIRSESDLIDLLNGTPKPASQAKASAPVHAVAVHA